MPDITTTTTITTDQLPWSPEDMAEFDRLVQERQVFKINEDLAKRCREDCDKRIAALLLLAGAGNGKVVVQSGPLKVQYVTSTSASKLDPRLLLEAGVSANTIANATTKGKEYSYVLVTGGKP